LEKLELKLEIGWKSGEIRKIKKFSLAFCFFICYYTTVVNEAVRRCKDGKM